MSHPTFKAAKYSSTEVAYPSRVESDLGPNVCHSTLVIAATDLTCCFHHRRSEHYSAEEKAAPIAVMTTLLGRQHLAIAAFFFTPSAAIDFLDAADEISVQVPSWLTPLYWWIIVIMCLLAAIMVAGQGYVASLGSTAKSTIALIMVDTLAYFTLAFSLLLLAIATVVSKPWEAISPTFLGPLSAFLASCVFAQNMRLYERGILNLWLRVSSMTIVNEMSIDLNALHAGARAAALPPEDGDHDTEDDIIALVRADRAGGIASAASNKGYSRPFMNIVYMWWRQGSAQNLPLTLVRRRVNGSTILCRTPRAVTHSSAIGQLVAAGRRIMDRDESGETTPVVMNRVNVITAFSCASRYVVHAQYGNIWMRIAKQPGLDKSSEAWWFLGTEIVQSLKAACGVKYISGPGRYNSVESLWHWVDELGYGWRKEYQIIPVAEELAKDSMQDGHAVAEYAMKLAGLRSTSPAPSEEVSKIATEANCVAALGLAVKVNVRQLQASLEDFCSGVTELLLNCEDVFVERDSSGAAAIIATKPEVWPEHELAIFIVKWISDAAAAGGRAQAPAPITAGAGPATPPS